MIKKLFMVCVALMGTTSCYYGETETSEDFEAIDLEDDQLVDDPPEIPKESTAGVSKGSDESDDTYEDDGFDPCPEVEYVLWEDETGQKFTVVIEVFCDPFQNINTGCPILVY